MRRKVRSGNFYFKKSRYRCFDRLFTVIISVVRDATFHSLRSFARSLTRSVTQSLIQLLNQLGWHPTVCILCETRIVSNQKRSVFFVRKSKFPVSQHKKSAAYYITTHKKMILLILIKKFESNVIWDFNIFKSPIISRALDLHF